MHIPYLNLTKREEDKCEKDCVTSQKKIEWMKYYVHKNNYLFHLNCYRLALNEI